MPTDETKAQVKALVVAGVNQPQIARVIGISEPTLRKHYPDELETGLSKTLANVADTLVQKALNGDTTSAIFFLKTRGKDLGWSERHEHSGPDGGPIRTETKVDLSKLSDAALAELETALGGGGTGGEGEA